MSKSFNQSSISTSSQTAKSLKLPADARSKATEIRSSPRRALQVIDRNVLHNASTSTIVLSGGRNGSMKRKSYQSDIKLTPPSSSILTTPSESEQHHENIAWLDMLVALLERKYGSYQLPVCIDDLETAYEERLGQQNSKRPRPNANELDIISNPSMPLETESKRNQLVQRHAQQIHLSSVTSSNCCGCKTGCLKMYCVCFSTRGFCHPRCHCENCKNTRNPTFQNERLQAIQHHVHNDPRAFAFASQHTTALNGFFQLLPEKASTVVLRGCRCQKSKCSKKYCECFQNGVSCTPYCRCVDCSNESGESKPHPTTTPSSNGAVFHAIQVAVTKKPRRNHVHKTVRLRL